MPAERAGYTVTMFLIDVSPSMGKLRSVEVEDDLNGGTRSVEMTNLEWSLQFVLLKIQEMIFHGRKTDQCGVILFGTEETDNIISESAGGYEHVSEFIEIAQPNAGTLAKLQALRPSTFVGDPVDAIIVGVETQDRYLGKRKTWTRKLVLLTDGENPIEVEDWELIIKKINNLDIITTIIGIDFDDEEFGFEEEDKSIIKRENEKFFNTFISLIKEGYGIIGTTAFALQECVRPDVKVTKSALMGTTLRLGDVDARAGEAIELPVKMSKCTAVVRPASMKKFARRVLPKENVAKDKCINDDESGKATYAQLSMQTDYFLGKGGISEDEMEGENSDENGENRSEKVDKEQLIRGFKYGASYAPCPDGQFPRLTTRKGIDICGFFSDQLLRRDLAMGEVQYIWADPSSGQTQVAFSSIVQAMLARGVVAIARWVSRDEMDPKMGVLIPRDFEKVDCFLWLQMPFADDVRKYTFPSLDNLSSKGGETIKKHPFIPTDEQSKAMDHFVDAMDLMQAGDKDEKGQRTPWFDPRLSYNPAVHRIKQALFHAAVVTDLRTNPIPPPHPEISKYFDPPRRILKRTHDVIEECKNAFRVKHVPKKVPRRRKDGHVLADDDDNELLLDLPKNSLSNAARNQNQKLSQSDDGNGRIKEEKMDIDSETEPESEVEMPQVRPEEGEDTLSQPVSSPGVNADGSQSIVIHDGRISGRIVGIAHPLKDFKDSLLVANLSEKAISDLAFVIKDIITKPFASRREKEVIECMLELRLACLNGDHLDTWNSFLRDLKNACLFSLPGNKTFWQSVCRTGRSLGLISTSETNATGGVSGDEADEFIRT